MPNPVAPSGGIFTGLSYRFDAFSIPEGVTYLFKKSIGFPNTTPQGFLTNEVADNNNSFPFITNNKIYNQNIPQSNLPLNTYILDPSFNNINFKFLSPNLTDFRNDKQGARYYSSNYPYIAYYSNLLLSKTGDDSGLNPIYTTLNTVSYGHPLLVNAIPITLVPYANGSPGSYSTTLLTSNIGAQTVIQPTNGYWLVDTDSGILTVYDAFRAPVQLGPVIGPSGNPTGEYRLPRISFYRYEGLIGSTNVANAQDF
jgi:hypothetical protein